MKMNYSYEDYPIGAEKFVPLNFHGMIVPKYEVTDYGRVYNNETHKFSAVETTYNGYQRVRITPTFKDGTNYSLHRCVMLSFNPIDNFREMQVNHKDGDKTNNHLDNLEWVTSMQNIEHAERTGLRNHKGSNHAGAKYTDLEIRQICNLIDQGYSNGEIATILKPELHGYEREKFVTTIYNIKRGINWQHISQEYNFMNGNIFRRYDESFAHKVCKILSEPNHNYTYTDIMVKLNLPENEFINFKWYIHRLFNNDTATLVTRKYNLKKPLDY